MDASELKEKLKVEAKIVVAKKKKRGGYTVYPQVVDVVETNIPLIGGKCYAIVYED